jgi:hypothetical protein
MVSTVSASSELRPERRPELVKSLFEQISSVDLGWDQTLNKEVWPTIPVNYWSVVPAAPAADGSTRLMLRGAVLVRIRALKKKAK